MAFHRVLNEDWSEYNYRKKSAGTDPSYFSASEKWEIEFLEDKIARTHPGLSHAEIKKAIIATGKILVPPCPRSTFVQCVMGGLGS